MLEVKALSFDYLDTPLLHNIKWSLNNGRLMHLCAKNGAGKTTLLRLLAGLMLPISGDILWENQSIYADLEGFQRKICYVGHKTGLSSILTVWENCFFDAHWQRKAFEFSDLLARFELEGLAETPCFQLSAGQQRRVALLRLVMSDALIWLLDEPYAALDTSGARILTSCLEEHLAGNGLIVMSSHLNLPENLRDNEIYWL